MQGWSWMASLRNASDNDYHYCGGSLIANGNPSWVLTAAHCIHANILHDLVYLGGYMLSESESVFR